MAVSRDLLLFLLFLLIPRSRKIGELVFLLVFFEVGLGWFLGQIVVVNIIGVIVIIFSFFLWLAGWRRWRGHVSRKTRPSEFSRLSRDI